MISKNLCTDRVTCFWLECIIPFILQRMAEIHAGDYLSLIRSIRHHSNNIHNEKYCKSTALIIWPCSNSILLHHQHWIHQGLLCCYWQLLHISMIARDTIQECNKQLMHIILLIFLYFIILYFPLCFGISESLILCMWYWGDTYSWSSLILQVALPHFFFFITMHGGKYIPTRYS